MTKNRQPKVLVEGYQPTKRALQLELNDDAGVVVEGNGIQSAMQNLIDLALGRRRASPGKVETTVGPDPSVRLPKATSSVHIPRK